MMMKMGNVRVDDGHKNNKFETLAESKKKECM